MTGYLETAALFNVIQGTGRLLTLFNVITGYWETDNIIQCDDRVLADC